MDRVRTISARDLNPYDSPSRSSLLGGSRSKNPVKYNWNGRVVAVKFLTEDAQEDVLSERAKSWSGFPRQNVGEVIAVSNRACSPLFVVLPYYSNGNITQFLARHPESNRENMILDIALGMQSLHSYGITHGGLKPTNIMITDNLQVCITDFEMVRIQHSRNNESHRYFSPEAWKGLVSFPSDVYAFAMSAYEILTSRVPWGPLSMSYIYNLVVGEGARPDRPEDVTDKVWSILEESWDQEPRLRPTFDIIIRMWQDPNEAAYSIRGGPRRGLPRNFNSSRPAPAISRWSDTTATEPPAYEPPSSRVPRPLPIPVQESSTAPSISQSLHHPRNSGGSGAYVSARTEPYSPPYTSISSCSSISTPSAYDLFSPPPRTPLTPVSAPIGTSAQREGAFARPVPVIGDPPSRNRGHSEDQQLDEDSPVLGRFDAMRQALPSPSRTHTSSPSIISNSESIRNWESSHRQTPSSRSRLRTSFTISAETVSVRSNSGSSGSSGTGGSESSTLFLVGGLQTEMAQGRRSDSRIDAYMAKIYRYALESDLNSHRLITAGVVPLLISLLKRRAADDRGLEVVLITLGVLSHDSISANLICRTQTAKTLIQLCNPRNSEEVVILSLWCLNRICRNAEVATGLIKLNLVSSIQELAVEGVLPTMAIYCLGTLIQSDAIADTMESLDIIPYLLRKLRKNSQDGAPPEDTCSGLYAIARFSRSIKLAKSLARAGCIPLLTFNLRYSKDPEVLNWSARAIGCLMRPNSTDMAKLLLDAGAAEGLARLPTVLPSNCLYPLESFGFAIQRFSCAEWGKRTRVALLDAGVIDSLLAALRTAAVEPCNEVQVSLALGLSLLGDVGGSVIRKEIENAGGIDILKSVGSRGSSDVYKACDMAITSITGNVLTRSAAAARTAMLHDWIGGCSDYQPDCPLTLTTELRQQ